MRKIILNLFLFSVCFTLFAQKQPLYKDTKAPVEKRVEDLLSRMTLEEKVWQMQNKPVGDGNIEHDFNKKSYGTTHEMSKSAQECSDIYDKLQHYMIEETRLGIPILTAAEGVQGILQNNSTLFPHSLAQASTFNTQLMKRMASAAADEARAMGIRQVLSPVLDIARELRWGRVEETYGEDPFLIAEMGIAFVNGYQEKGVACMPKHFVAHGTPVGGLNCAAVSGGERELRSLYIYPFKRVIKEAKPLAIMSAYSAYDGIPTSASPYFMTDILRDELGFDGYVYSDWGSVERVKTFHYAVATDEEAAQVSVEAGVDLNVGWTYELLPKLIESGKMDVKYIDQAVRRILLTKFSLGLFDEPYHDPTKVEKVVRSAKYIALAKEMADESTILLKNENNILPLDLSKYKSIAVLGPNSNQAVYGDYSWVYGDTKEGVNLYEGLQDRLGNKVLLNQADGCDWWSQNDEDIQAAVDLAMKSDLAIVAVGTRSNFLGRSPNKSTAGEGFDLSSLELPGKQRELLKAVKETGKPMIVILISGKPMVMTWAKQNADAVLAQWYSGEQQGNALADILLGTVNPSGRLNVSMPQSTGNTPCFYNYYPTDREQQFDSGGSYDDPKGHYIFEKPYALWEFGYGLSYTNFEYSNFKVNKREFSSDDDKIVVTLDVANIGAQEGKEVVQLYIRDKVSSVATPIKQLKAFDKVNLAVGSSVKVSLEVPLSELALYDVKMNKVIESGEFEIQIGKSSENIIFTETVTYTSSN